MTPDILNLIGDYGAMGIVFVFFIYQYFKERGKADTLKNANTDRKTDTDEVAEELRDINSFQNTDIALLKQKLDAAVCKLDKIESNDLCHLKVQLENNATDHQKIFVAMAEMKIMLENLTKK